MVDLRPIFKTQLDYCTAIAKDIVKHNASKEICLYAGTKAQVEHPYGEEYEERNGIRINWGECYAYITLDENKRPTGKITYTNDEMGDFAEDYSYDGTVNYLNTISKEYIYDYCQYSDCYDEYDGKEEKYKREYIPFETINAQKHIKVSQNGKEILMPLNDYLETKAYQYGFDSYSELVQNGYSIDITMEKLYDADGKVL